MSRALAIQMMFWFSIKKEILFKGINIKYSSRAEIIWKIWALKYQDFTHNPKVHQCYIIWIELNFYWIQFQRQERLLELRSLPKANNPLPMKVQLYAIPNKLQSITAEEAGDLTFNRSHHQHFKDDLKLLRGQWGSFRKVDYHRQVQRLETWWHLIHSMEMGT